MLRVIDLHVHIAPYHMLRPEARRTFLAGKDNREEIERYSSDAASLLRLMDTEQIDRIGIMNYVSPDVIGPGPDVNEWALRLAAADPVRLIAFGSVHPRYTTDPGGDVGRLVEQGARALKIHPPHQEFAANAYVHGLDALAKIYLAAEETGIPVTIHTGTSVFPGARSRLGHPMDVDDVAIDFSDLTILLAHGGRPLWMNEAFFVVRRHPNVYLELSGIPPARLLDWFPRLEEIADKVVWGSDWPSPGVLSMRTNVEQFLALPLGEDTKRKILHDNAARLFPEP
jgi:predicted TIM-barrel fold metal-dependent hydrolase